MRGERDPMGGSGGRASRWERRREKKKRRPAWVDVSEKKVKELMGAFGEESQRPRHRDVSFSFGFISLESFASLMLVWAIERWGWFGFG